MDNLKDISTTLEFAATELIKFGKLKKDCVLVLGCSTSEVVGKKIGTFGSLDVAKIIYDVINKVVTDYSIHLAVQCCEHLNRALVVEKEVADKLGLEVVNVVPSIHAGGAMATYTYSQFKEPCIVEFIKADAGVDIGNVLIGMHLKHVAVPFKIEGIKTIGNASIVMAFTRPKYIGGSRATYNPW